MSLTCKPKKRMKRWIKLSYITRIKTIYKGNYPVLLDPNNNHRTLTSIFKALVLLPYEKSYLRRKVYEGTYFCVFVPIKKKPSQNYRLSKIVNTQKQI